MSDSDELDIGEGDAPEASTAPKKKGGLGALLPTILKFAAIGAAALIFIITVSAITVDIKNKGGKNQTIVADPTSPYIGKRPIYSWYTDIGSISTKTRDSSKDFTVTVVMNIGYDQNDTAAASELNNRKIQLQEFVRVYFAGKFADDLKPENEVRIKKEIKDQLNTRLLDIAKVQEINFTKLDVMEIF